LFGFAATNSEALVDALLTNLPSHWLVCRLAKAFADQTVGRRPALADASLTNRTEAT